jgi:NAD(P)-dependent dehydrogenase (short-subunit alcohol dehydrogenase family)
MRLAGKTALVTGAGSGIGKATADLFEREGAAVAGADVNGATFTVDVSNPDEVGALVEEVLRRHERVDVLVNAAGVLVTGDAVATSLDEWHRVIDVNLTGTFLCARAVLPEMLASGGGAIVNFSSSTGSQAASRGAAGYVTSKAGVAMLTKALAVDFADRGVRVNAICPGPVDTPMIRSRFGETELATFAASLPVKRLGRPEEIAAVALFLASDEASFVTGALVAADGGQTAGVWTPQ